MIGRMSAAMSSGYASVCNTFLLNQSKLHFSCGVLRQEKWSDRLEQWMKQWALFWSVTSSCYIHQKSIPPMEFSFLSSSSLGKPVADCSYCHHLWDSLSLACLSYQPKLFWSAALRVWPLILCQILWMSSLIAFGPGDQHGLKLGLKLDLCSQTNKLQRFYLLWNPWINCMEFEFFLGLLMMLKSRQVKWLFESSIPTFSLHPTDQQEFKLSKFCFSIMIFWNCEFFQNLMLDIAWYYKFFHEFMHMNTQKSKSYVDSLSLITEIRVMNLWQQI